MTILVATLGAIATILKARASRKPAIATAPARAKR